MTEEKMVVSAGDKRRPHYSRPVFRQVLKVNSLQAQRVMDRSFRRAAYSLFSTGVILRIIGVQEEIDQVESLILEDISKVSEEFDKALIQLSKLKEDNGIDMMPGYTHPNEYTLEISSPQTAQFAHLIRKLDSLIALVDTLWLNAVLTNIQHINATYQWQQSLIKLANRIIAIERRARISASKRGKEEEVAQVAPEAEISADDITEKTNTVDAALSA